MSLGKKYIIQNISSKAQIPSVISSRLLNVFVEIIKTESITKKVKISNFGKFFIHQTPLRKGRNPKTKEEYIIPKMQKLSFQASNKIKNFIN